MKKYFENLFEFNSWANDKVIEKIMLLNSSEDEIIKLMSHIISAQDTWLERIKGKQNYSIDIWEIFTIQELQILSDNSSKSWIKFIKKINASDMEKICIYKNSKRKIFNNQFHDIFTHVINHSSYHRAQINLLLKSKNIGPAEIDYILFEREKLNF